MLKVTKTFVPGAAHNNFVHELLTDIIASQKNKGNTQKMPNLKGKWDRLKNVICNVEKKSNINSIKKRVVSATLNKGLAEGDLQSLMKEHNFKFGTDCARFIGQEKI